MPDSVTSNSSTAQTADSVSVRRGGMPSLKSVGNEAIRQKVFESMARIERHLMKRDPAALARIFENYTGQQLCLQANHNAGLQQQQQQQLLPMPQLVANGAFPFTGPSTSTSSSSISFSSSSSVGQGGRRRLNFRQRRMEQDQIDIKNIEHLKIPSGVALRGLLVPTPPDSIFNDNCPDLLPNYATGGDCFAWCETNENNAAECSRRAMNRELIKQTLEKWVFLYFRIQRRNWERLVVDEKRNTPDINMYAEDQIGKWTLKMRFKILKMAPIKVALKAFLSRMGLENDPNVVFCRDGFYGQMDVGNILGELNKTPHAQISFNSTPKYLNLKNGDSIFVNSCSSGERQLMEETPRTDVSKARQKEDSIDGEEGEMDYSYDEEQE